MSVHDIIEAATPGPWIHQSRYTSHRATAVGTSGPYPFICECGFPINKSAHPQDVADARFIAAFDPEHVALMEAVCEAVGRCGTGLVMDAPHEWRTVAEAHDALTAYRKERGL